MKKLGPKIPNREDFWYTSESGYIDTEDNFSWKILTYNQIDFFLIENTRPMYSLQKLLEIKKNGLD